MLQVTWSNSAGELDSRRANDEEEAALAAIQMLASIVRLHAGDTITVTEVQQ